MFQRSFSFLKILYRLLSLNHFTVKIFEFIVGCLRLFGILRFFRYLAKFSKDYLSFFGGCLLDFEICKYFKFFRFFQLSKIFSDLRNFSNPLRLLDRFAPRNKGCSKRAKIPGKPEKSSLL